MTIGTYEEQIKCSAESKEEDLIYYGIVLFGYWEKVTAMTKKFLFGNKTLAINSTAVYIRQC